MTRPELTVEMPVIYAQTSGTTGSPKYVPITPTGIERQARAQRLLASMVARHSNIFAGKILGIGSPAIEGHRPSGKPFGSASGLIFDGMPSLIRSRYVVSNEIAAMKDHDARYFEIATASLLSKDLRAMATANPSTLLRIHEVIVERWDELLRAVSLQDDGRGRELRALDGNESLPFDALWPEVEVVTTWTSGSCGLALERLLPLLPANIKLIELGYSASELRGSVATEPGRSDSVPLLGDVYFEFVERTAWEAGEPRFVGLADLTSGRSYYVFITTIDGLYRYDMNDIVEAVDVFHSTPDDSFRAEGQRRDEHHRREALRESADRGRPACRTRFPSWRRLLSWAGRCGALELQTVYRGPDRSTARRARSCDR